MSVFVRTAVDLVEIQAAILGVVRSAVEANPAAASSSRSLLICEKVAGALSGGLYTARRSALNSGNGATRTDPWAGLDTLRHSDGFDVMGGEVSRTGMGTVGPNVRTRVCALRTKAFAC